MTTEILEQDPLPYIRQLLQGMQPSQLARIAVAANITERTLYNVMKAERDVKHSTVMALAKALKEAEAVEPQADAHGHP